MDGKFLGKITDVKFGLNPESPREPMLWMKLTFNFNSGSETEFSTINMDRVRDTLANAQVNDIYALKGKPVEVQIGGNVLAKWRILTEVI